MPRWSVPVYSRSTLNVCWEACGRMLYAWRRRGLGGYEERAGRYAHLDVGLPEVEMHRFSGRLGLRSRPRPQGKNVRHALGWTPVIVTSTNQVHGHAMVVSGHEDGHYLVINPCAVETVSFDDGGDSCQGAALRLPRSDIDARLGSRIWYW